MIYDYFSDDTFDAEVAKLADKLANLPTKGLAYTVLMKLYMHEKNWAKAIECGRELMKPEYGMAAECTASLETCRQSFSLVLCCKSRPYPVHGRRSGRGYYCRYSNGVWCY